MGRFLFGEEFVDEELEQESADDFAEYVRITRDIAAIIKLYRRPEQRRAVAWISNQDISDRTKLSLLQVCALKWSKDQNISDYQLNKIYRECVNDFKLW